MFKEIKRAILFTLVTMVLLGGGYNVLVWAIGRTVFPAQAEGSLIRRADGTVVGSRLIAQKFSRPEYFQPRPSGVEYNAASTGGTNYGPSNPDHLKAVQERLDALTKQEGVQASQVPSEMVTASGGGMDPHIPPAAAELQAQRVASARGVPIDRVRELIQSHTEPPTFGFLGRARVNVLELNLALDERLGAKARQAAGKQELYGRTRTTACQERRSRHTISIWDPGIVGQAMAASFRKLDPRIQVKNPVMFIVEVGSLITTIVFIQELAGGDRSAAVHGAGRLLALVHGALRQFCGGDGRGSRQGAGRHASQDPD